MLFLGAPKSLYQARTCHERHCALVESHSISDLKPAIRFYTLMAHLQENKNLTFIQSIISSLLRHSFICIPSPCKQALVSRISC